MYLTTKMHMIISIDAERALDNPLKHLHPLWSPCFFHAANCLSYFSISLDTFTTLSIFISQENPTFFPLLEDIRQAWLTFWLVIFHSMIYPFCLSCRVWKTIPGKKLCTKTDWWELQWCGWNVAGPVPLNYLVLGYFWSFLPISVSQLTSCGQ